MNSPIISLNVGGTRFDTSQSTLTKDRDSLLASWFSDLNACPLPKDKDGRFFIDRDGELFRYILNFLRNDPSAALIPDSLRERERLTTEAEFYRLSAVKECLHQNGVARSGSPVGELDASLVRTSISTRSGYITVGYQGSFSFGRQGMAADINFRKINRILVSGKVSLCRSVFADTLNECRDPDRGQTDRYTARFYLKHTFLEQCFDNLAEAGFKLVGSCASGTSTGGDGKLGQNTEEERWAHYNEFVFCRE